MEGLLRYQKKDNGMAKKQGDAPERQESRPVSEKLYFVDSFKRRGAWGLIKELLVYVFVSWVMYVSVNPSVFYNFFKRKDAKQESELIGKRMEMEPRISTVLKGILYDTGADRAYILEMHNTVENVTLRIPFLYVDMKYEEINDSTYNVIDEYVDFPLDRYPFVTGLFRNRDTMWYGPVDSIAPMDKRFAARLAVDEDRYVAFILLKNEKSVPFGILGVSFVRPETDVNESRLVEKCTSAAQVITGIYLYGKSGR